MEPARVLITGAAGNIAYILTTLIANGSLFGPDRKVILQLLDLPQCLQKLSALAMELEDAAFPTLADVVYSDDISVVAKDVDYAFLLASVTLFGKEGYAPRSFYIPANTPIFKAHGEALSNFAKPTVKIIVVSSPPNTNALVAMKAAPKLGPQNWGSLSFLDHTRARSYLSRLLKVPVKALHKVSVWGNHSPTQFADGLHAEVEIDGEVKKVTEILDPKILKGDFTDTVGDRGYAVVRAKGGSAVLSTANAAFEMMKNWIFGSNGNWVSMGIPVPDDQPYGIEKGIFFSFSFHSG